ncbi:uncharacterized protein DUF547 [Thermoflavifilum aggregans]|uniref:Uncharacterized protein DUF547 n=1 Tax=Thermoflavifilum aggregans TaxID=454188 RepID=A0A2M9CSX9_9BACT|nr:DUF547 domain-containing protein [Thermoflavifilum aggregans]PJJ75014.1 uncharacterized protein DUF547 [Thermoflavifilum aggregans]
MFWTFHGELAMGICLSLVSASVFSFPPGKPLVTDCVRLSEELLYAVRTGDSTQAVTDSLAQADEQILVHELRDDSAKKAFWLNLYNAFVQILLQDDTTAYRHRSAFFSRKSITVAGHLLSLDDIEHGMLRHSKIKWSLGYLNKPFPSAFEKALRVNKVDYRIHFALNCGARSCPPIAFYDPVHIDQQLDLATQNYLYNEVKYDSVRNILYLPAIMGWFRHDFGGKQHMIALVSQLGFLPRNADPKIRFKKYDWTLFLHHFQNNSSL